MEGSPHGYVHRAAKAGHVGLEKRFAVAVGGIADRNVQPAKCRHRGFDHALDRGLVGHVAGQQDGAAAGALDLVDGRGRFARVLAIVKCNTGTGFGQRDGHRQTDSLAGAGDDAGMALQG